MNNTNNRQKNNILIYSILIGISVIFITYLIYSFTTNNTDNNILKNSHVIKEENNLVNIYNDPHPTSKLLSSYSTNLYDKDKNRIHNIKKACNILNGYVIKSNEEFSFNKAVGKIDKSTGYKLAIGFDSNGNNIQIYGGGICQLSSTLYNAVLNAKLKVTERHAHSKQVSYVPKNKDATICSGGADFKFLNNSTNDIIIYAKTDGINVTVELMSIKN